MNLNSAVEDSKVMQDFDSESLSTGIDILKMVKAISVESDYGLKDCVTLLSSTAEFRLNLTELSRCCKFQLK